MTIVIDLLYVADCPNVALARRRVDEAVARSGAVVTIREREIADVGGAERFAMQGSPTILVDGRDAVARNEGASVSCRLYPTTTGLDGAPTVDQLVRALAS